MRLSPCSIETFSCTLKALRASGCSTIPAPTPERRQQMLNRREHHACPHERRGVRAMRDPLDAGRNLKVAEVRANEDVARIGRGRSETQVDGHGSVQAESLRLNWRGKSGLFNQARLRAFRCARAEGGAR